MRPWPIGGGFSAWARRVSNEGALRAASRKPAPARRRPWTWRRLRWALITRAPLACLFSLKTTGTREA
eukprot:3793654-Lingulodinium_polyedra.AAC.1